MSNPILGAQASFSRRDVLRLGAASTFAASAGGLLVACSDRTPSENGAAATGPAQKGGTLTVGLVSEGNTEALDPWVFLGVTGYVRCVQLYDTLVEYDDNLNVQPALAESSEVSADKRTWTFRLRKGVTFHDGSSLTADDVIHNVRAWTDPSSWAASNGATVIDPKQVSKVDDHTVRIGLNSPDARFDRMLAFLAFSIKSRNEKKGGPAIGTGPFKFVSFTPGTRSEFVRFDDHWRSETAHLDRLVIDTSFTDEKARVNALLSGQADLVPQVAFGLARTIPAETARLMEVESGAFNNLYMAVDTPPFDDVNVRQAMRLLVDRQAMVDVTYAGHGEVSNDVPGRFTPWYDESLVRERDIDQAKFLLKKAGREDLTVTLQTSAVSDPITQAATLFKAQAKDAGVTVNLQQIDPGSYYVKYGQWSFAQTLYIPVASMEYIWSASFVSTGVVNETHWQNSPYFEHTKSLVQESKATDDESKLTEIWRELQKEQFDKGGYINYGTFNYLDAVANRVQGLTPSKYFFASGFNLRKAWLAD